MRTASPVLMTDILEWARWFERAENRRVAETNLPNGIMVSTVFLGLDHNFYGGPPVLWETMIFGGPHDQYQERYTSREAALEGHEEAVRLAQQESETT